MNRRCKINLSDGWEVVVTRNLADVESLRPVWEKLQNEETFPVPNADIDRYIAVIEPLKDTAKPHIILLLHNNNPEAMVIGRIEKTRLNCRIGYKTLFNPTLKCLFIVYGGLIGRLTDNVLSILLQELLQTLAKREADVVLLNHLRTDSPIYHLVTTEPNILCRHHFPLIEPHWQTRLPDSKDAFFTSTRRRYLKRYMKELKDTCGEPIKIACYSSPQDIPRIVSEASAIARLTYKCAIGAGFKDDLRTRFILELASRQNRLRAYVLYAQHKPVAFEFGVEYGRVFFPGYIGYEPHLHSCSPGTILFLKVLEDLMENTTLRIFDYGFGEAVYKERFGTDFWLEGSVHIFALRLYPIVVNMLQSSIRGLSLTLKYILNRAGLVGWIKRNWRKILQAKEPECK